MEYIKATKEDLEQIWTLVQETIREVYPNYYPLEVVDFFRELHSKDNILHDIESGAVGILKDNDGIVGTGSYKDNHITRVFVKPTCQSKGYGSYIMKCLERKIQQIFDCIYLEASLPASHLYEKMGYHTIRHEKWNVENGRILVYEVMVKNVCSKNNNC